MRSPGPPPPPRRGPVRARPTRPRRTDSTPIDVVREAGARAVRLARPAHDGCLIWQGRRRTNLRANGVQLAVTWTVWAAHYGTIPSGAIEHHCAGGWRCVNIEHLHHRTPVTDVEWFMRSVDQNGPPHPYDPALGPCWIWSGRLTRDGYGKARGTFAHRVSVVLNTGAEIPRGMVVRHSCDRRWCVNPTHLQPGTHAENNADRDARFYRRSAQPGLPARVPTAIDRITARPSVASSVVAGGTHPSDPCQPQRPEVR